MRLIDADELKKKLKLWAFNNVTTTSPTFDFITEFDIDECPTVCDIEQIRAEIEECLEAINYIKAMPIQLYTPNEIEARKLTYEQCLGFIDKYAK